MGRALPCLLFPHMLANRCPTLLPRPPHIHWCVCVRACVRARANLHSHRETAVSMVHTAPRNTEPTDERRAVVAMLMIRAGVYSDETVAAMAAGDHSSSPGTATSVFHSLLTEACCRVEEQHYPWHSGIVPSSGLVRAARGIQLFDMQHDDCLLSPYLTQLKSHAVPRQRRPRIGGSGGSRQYLATTGHLLPRRQNRCTTFYNAGGLTVGISLHGNVREGPAHVV